VRQDAQFSPAKNDKSPCDERHTTQDVFTAIRRRDRLIHRLALLAALFAWGAPAAAQSMTGYPLVGVHATQACKTCHTTMPYKSAPTTCFGCHQKDVVGATTPVNHAGLPTTCDTCHSATDATMLAASTFNHSAYFALTGAHATATCAQCHNPPYAPSANNFTTVPTGPCSSCHLKDYNTATTPVNHIASNFPTTCDSCHKFSDATWLLATFSHTTFPLVGLHATTACAVCHNPPYAPSANNYTAVPTTCYGCHQKDVTGATTPVNHTGLPTTCDTCHKNTDANWLLASAFNHSAYFALAGAHVTAPCAQCHNPPYAPSLNNFTTVPTGPCSACHLKDYNTATTPVNHITAAFPTTCDTCHKFSDATWLLGTFNHTYFPLTSNHNRPCADCHKTAGVYTVFTCTDCHTNAQITPHHSGVKGYVWTSTACYSCHPNGRAG
jgi:hypothetical protein